MSLRALPTDPHLETSTGKLLDSFFVPALKQAISYDRGVGFFNSHWLRLAATGLAGLAANGGTARIIASPMLDPADCAALSQGVDARVDPILKAALERAISDLEDDLATDTLSALAWMIADEILDFRIAIPTAQLDGDFHDKFGIFRDSDGNSVAFHGSANDSERAFRNYESISIYYSWVDAREAARVAAHSARFDLLWSNGDINLRVYPLPDAVKRNLIDFTTRLSRPYARPQYAPEIDRWKHQKEAADAFLKVRHGVLEMATGTGKTRTAISILNSLLNDNAVDSAIVTMAGSDLLEQWYLELVDNLDVGVYRHFGPHKEASRFLSSPNRKLLLIGRQQLSAVLPTLPERSWERTIIVCDEVHGFGSPSMVENLQGVFQRYGYRLGLSATPDREYDEVGNDFIKNEIGPVLFRFGLEDAIRCGILCEFDYTALAYELTEDDRLEIKQIIARHHARKASGDDVADENLYREIARVRKVSTSKLPPFSEHLDANRDLYRNCIIFVETSAFGHMVQDILIKRGIDYHTYYQGDDAEHLNDFAKGKIDCLISCRRLSEGIDIRSVRNIVLFASARSELETTQRLGRSLRKDPSDPKKRAHVVDFVDLGSHERSYSDGYDADILRYQRLSALSKIMNEQ